MAIVQNSRPSLNRQLKICFGGTGQGSARSIIEILETNYQNRSFLIDGLSGGSGKMNGGGVGGVRVSCEQRLGALRTC